MQQQMKGIALILTGILCVLVEIAIQNAGILTTAALPIGLIGLIIVFLGGKSGTPKNHIMGRDHHRYDRNDSI